MSNVKNTSFTPVFAEKCAFFLTFSVGIRVFHGVARAIAAAVQSASD